MDLLWWMCVCLVAVLLVLCASTLYSYRHRIRSLENELHQERVHQRKQEMTYTSDVKRMRRELKDSGRQQQALAHDVQDLKVQHSVEIVSLEKRLDDSRQKYKILRQKYTKCEREHDVTKLANTVHTLQNEKKLLSAELHATKQKLETQKAVCDSLGLNLSSTYQVLSVTENELYWTKDSLATTHLQIRQADDKLAAYAEKLEDNWREWQAMEEELEAKTLERQQLAAAVTESQSQLQELEQSNIMIKRNLQKRKKDLRKVENQNARVEALVEDKRVTLDEVTSRLRSAQEMEHAHIQRHASCPNVLVNNSTFHAPAQFGSYNSMTVTNGHGGEPEEGAAAADDIFYEREVQPTEPTDVDIIRF